MNAYEKLLEDIDIEANRELEKIHLKYVRSIADLKSDLLQRQQLFKICSQPEPSACPSEPAPQILQTYKADQNGLSENTDQQLKSNDNVDQEEDIDVIKESEEIDSTKPINKDEQYDEIERRASEKLIDAQKILDDARLKTKDFIIEESRKHLAMFIKTQINCISSETNSIHSRSKNLSDLFSGQQVLFQKKILQANHPSAILFCMDTAAQHFVSVGSKLTSKGDLSTSLAQVISNLIALYPSFNDLLFAHLKIKCPFLVPMFIQKKDYDDEFKYKIACGYAYDDKTNIFETEEKYNSKMQSLVKIFASTLVSSNLPHHLWSWIVNSLAFYPQTGITALILDAFLEQASNKLKQTYRQQYSKLINFVKTDYLQMIEKVSRDCNVQTLIKLKNLLTT